MSIFMKDVFRDLRKIAPSVKYWQFWQPLFGKYRLESTKFCSGERFWVNVKVYFKMILFEKLYLHNMRFFLSVLGTTFK